MAYVNLGQIVYPVGSVYISYTNVSPANLFGGNWTAITGHFPYFNAGTSTGGSNNITYDFSHTHALRYNFSSKYGYSNGIKYTVGESVPEAIVASHRSSWSDVSANVDIGEKLTLGKKTLSNMPAYQTFYAWRRTS